MESKNDNIIKFYFLANKLKEKIRTGWIQIGIEKERLESVAEHIYGCLILAIAIKGEYNLDIDMHKVLKILALHELEEILLGDLTLRDKISKEEKIKRGKVCVHEVVKGLMEEKEIESLLDEFNEGLTKEALFCYHIDKLECDFQAKVYDIMGVFSLEKAKEDLKYYGNRAKEIEQNAKTASDIWIGYDIPKFNNDEIFMKLVTDLKEKN